MNPLHIRQRAYMMSKGFDYFVVITITLLTLAVVIGIVWLGIKLIRFIF